jgi:protein TonB
MAFAHAPGRTRIGGAIAAAAFELVLAALIVSGLAVTLSAPADSEPRLVTVTLDRPQPPVVQRESGATAGHEISSKAHAPVPSQAIILLPPRAVVAEGSSDSVVSGMGQGVGDGEGTGTGEGNGEGAVPTPPHRIAGTLGDRDYPRAARGAGGTVAISFRVRGDGRVDSCQVISSSGSAVLDGLTCDLVENRFRYRPARDAAGLVVEATQRTSFTWGTRPRD